MLPPREYLIMLPVCLQEKKKLRQIIMMYKNVPQNLQQWHGLQVHRTHHLLEMEWKELSQVTRCDFRDCRGAHTSMGQKVHSSNI